MKPLIHCPVQPGPIDPPGQMSGPLPRWVELPQARQQEVLVLLANLLQRHWPHPPNSPQEVTYDRHL